MKRLLYIVWISLLLFSLSLEGRAGEGFSRNYVDSCMIRIENGDTLYMAWLHEVWVYPPMKFKNKRQEKFYWKTVRDVNWRNCPMTKVEEGGGGPLKSSSIANTRRTFAVCMPRRG